MSTKLTVAYGKNFHLYKEILDENFIYLEIEGVQFEASYNRVMMPIPVHIWEVIRQYEGTDLSWASKTDEEIVRYVEQEVDKRITKLKEAENEKSGATPRYAERYPLGRRKTFTQLRVLGKGTRTVVDCRATEFTPTVRNPLED